jgi:cysteine-rich repeat protein
MRLLPLLLLAACQSDPVDSAWTAPGCGDGVLDADEECDDGADNHDGLADACRRDCRLPRCGDLVVDSDEDCDDGAFLGGDGCTPGCVSEVGQSEVEPNDDSDSANTWIGPTAYGSLIDGDIDCYAVDATDCGDVGAALVGECPDLAVLGLYDPEGARIAQGSPGADGCAVLDPFEAEGARLVDGGRWTVCVEGLLGEDVPGYGLQVEVTAVGEVVHDVDEADDPDGDGLPDRCDLDRDGDGVLDDDDNCPDVQNGPDATPLAPDSDGLLRSWLRAGPYTGLSSPDTCLPSVESLVAEDDSTALPAIGDAAGTLLWSAFWSDIGRVSLYDLATVDAPREAYIAVYVRSDTTRSATLALGPDDGARAWLGGVEVLSINGCQGTTLDQFQAEVELVEGWQTLLIKVFDQGGDWANYARFLDADGAPVLDLELSLDPAGAWVSDQTDSDGDGLGDACDPEP